MTDDTTPIAPEEDDPEPLPDEDPAEPEYEPRTDPVTPDA